MRPGVHSSGEDTACPHRTFVSPSMLHVFNSRYILPVLAMPGYAQDGDTGITATSGAQGDVAPIADVQISNNRDGKSTGPRTGHDEDPPQHHTCELSGTPSVAGSVARHPVEALVEADSVNDVFRPPPSQRLRTTPELSSGSAMNKDCLAQLPPPTTSASQTSRFAQVASELPDNAVVEVGTLHRGSRGVVTTNGTGEGAVVCGHQQTGSEGKGKGIVGEEEASVESLLGSLMRALNTDQGRADFRRLTSEDSPFLS